VPQRRVHTDLPPDSPQVVASPPGVRPAWPPWPVPARPCSGSGPVMGSPDSDLEWRSGWGVRRIETCRPGELVPLDMRKLAKISPGRGHRAWGKWPRRPPRTSGTGRATPSATPKSTPPSTPTAAWPSQRSTATSALRPASVSGRRPKDFIKRYGIVIERVITDTGGCYLPNEFAGELLGASIAHTFTRPYRPRTARLSATTARCSTSGPTPAPAGKRMPEPGPLSPGSTATTITGTSRQSAARPSARSITR